MEDMAQNLRDAGCDGEEIATVSRLYGAGRVEEAVRVLRRRRRGLMEALHRSQERVDCLDFLLRRLEKELKTKVERTAD